MLEKKFTITYVPERRYNFTDRMYRVNLIFAVFVTLYILGLMTYSSFVSYIDLTPSAYIIAPIWVEVGAFSLANIRKHEKENRRGGVKNGDKSRTNSVSGSDNPLSDKRYE